MSLSAGARCGSPAMAAIFLLAVVAVMPACGSAQSAPQQTQLTLRCHLSRVEGPVGRNFAIRVDTESLQGVVAGFTAAQRQLDYVLTGGELTSAHLRVTWSVPGFGTSVGAMQYESIDYTATYLFGSGQLILAAIPHSKGLGSAVWQSAGSCS